MASSKYSLSNSDKGGDFDGYYTTIGTWESAVDGNTGNGELAELVIYAEVGDVGALTQAGWTSGALSKITVNPGDEHKAVKNDGVYGSGRWYLFTDAIVEDIELDGGYFQNSDGNTGAITRRCASYDSSIYGYNRIGYCYNCLSDSSTADAYYYLSGGVYNCTSIDSGNRGFVLTDAINCVAYNSTGDDFSPQGKTLSYCASEDSTATGTGSITGIASSVFANYAGGDYHLASDSTTVSGEGLNLIDNAPSLSDPQLDVDGDEWPGAGGGAWDIGFDYYVSGVIPDPDPLDTGLALGAIEYETGSMYLGDTEIETMFLGGINITQQYVTDENGAYLIDENNNYITYGD